MAQQSLGGNGYLSGEAFAITFAAGRILPTSSRRRRSNRALCPSRSNWECARSPIWTCCAPAMLGDISVPADDRLEAQLARHPDRHTIAVLADHLASPQSRHRRRAKHRKPLSLGSTELGQLVRSHAWHADQRAHQPRNDQVVRGLFGRRTCDLAHAGPGKRFLRRLEVSRDNGNGLLVASKTTGRS